MSRSRRFLGGLTFTYIYQVILLVAGIWLTPFYLRRIGQHDYGLWLVGTQLLFYLSLTDFGVVDLLPQEISYAKGRARGAEVEDDLSKVVGQTARLVLYQLPLVVIIAVAMFFGIPAEWQALRGPLGLVLMGFVIAFPLRMLPALLQGLQDLTFAGGMQVLSWILSTAATVSMVWAGWSLFALAAGWLVTQLALAPVFLYRIKTRFPGVLPRALPPFNWGKSKAQLGKSMWISVAQVAQLLMTNTDLLIIGKLLGPAAVVPYACTGKLISVLANQAQILMQTATPGLCELKTGESRERLLHALTALTHAILTFSGLVICLVLVVNHWFVAWWVTSKQWGGFALTAAFAVTVLIRHWTTTTAYSVFCLGHLRRLSLTNLGDGLASAASCVVLTALLGLPGAAISSVVGACSVSLVWNLRIMASDTGVSVRQLISAMLGGWLWRLLLMAGIAFWIGARWTPSSLVEAMGVSLLTGIVYCSVMFQQVLRSPLGTYIRPMLSTFRMKWITFQMRFSS